MPDFRADFCIFALNSLILQGARQVGKSWILKEFGKNEYDNVAYISCDNEPLAKALFKDYYTDRILRGIEAITGVQVAAEKTLIKCLRASAADNVRLYCAVRCRDVPLAVPTSVVEGWLFHREVFFAGCAYAKMASRIQLITENITLNSNAAQKPDT